MRHLNTIKESPNSNTIIEGTNTMVLTATFNKKSNHRSNYYADIYRFTNGVNQAVARGTCAPIHGIYKETVLIQL